MTRSNRSARRGAIALLLVVGACSGKKLEVADDKGAPVDDYGHADLLAATAEMAKAPTSPEAYRALATRIQELRPRFNDRVALEAELQLSFLAIGPLRAQLTASPEEQMAKLATTVWPTALAVEPLAAETPRAYLERVCSGTLAGECKYVVPEAWPV